MTKPGQGEWAGKDPGSLGSKIVPTRLRPVFHRKPLGKTSTSVIPHQHRLEPPKDENR
jgi:hypothetical protein